MPTNVEENNELSILLEAYASMPDAKKLFKNKNTPTTIKMALLAKYPEFVKLIKLEDEALRIAACLSEDIYYMLEDPSEISALVTYEKHGYSPLIRRTRNKKGRQTR